MSTAFEAFRRIARIYNVLVVVVVHTGKDEKKGTRGWSGLEGNADTILLLKATKELRTAEFTTRKVKDNGPLAQRLAFEGKVIDLGRTAMATRALRLRSATTPTSWCRRRATMKPERASGARNFSLRSSRGSQSQASLPTVAERMVQKLYSRERLKEMTDDQEERP